MNQRWNKLTFLCVCSAYVARTERQAWKRRAELGRCILTRWVNYAQEFKRKALRWIWSGGGWIGANSHRESTILREQFDNPRHSWNGQRSIVRTIKFAAYLRGKGIHYPIPEREREREREREIFAEGGMAYGDLEILWGFLGLQRRQSATARPWPELCYFTLKYFVLILEKRVSTS